MLVQDGHKVGQVDMARPWWWVPVLEGLDERHDPPPYEWPVGWEVTGATTDAAAFAADVCSDPLVISHWTADRVRAEFGYLPHGTIVQRSPWLPELLPPPGPGCWECIARG